MAVLETRQASASGVSERGRKEGGGRRAHSCCPTPVMITEPDAPAGACVAYAHDVRRPTFKFLFDLSTIVLFVLIVYYKMKLGGQHLINLFVL